VTGGIDFERDFPGPATLTYDCLIELIEHLKACVDIAVHRTPNWQHCCENNPKFLPLLLKASLALDEGVTPVMLQLLLSGLGGTRAVSEVRYGPAKTGPR
jgi:E3 ubiquitin-protein ligase UBR4